MKLAFLFILTLSFQTKAEVKIIKNPLFQGSPIYAGTIGGLARQDQAAHSVCRLAGYVRSKQSELATTYKTKYVVQPTMMLDTNSMISDPTIFYFLNFPMNFRVNNGSGFDHIKEPKFFVHKKVHACAEISACRNFNPNSLGNLSLQNKSHPFVRSCYDWATKGSQPVVFSEVTCETDLNEEWQQESLASLKEFHASTDNKFKVRSGTDLELKASLADPAQTCSKQDPRMLEGSIKYVAMGNCDYQFLETDKGRNDSMISDLFSYLALTGRSLKQISPNAPACVRNILAKYSQIVLKEEYELKAHHIGQAFCVEKVSSVEHTQDENGRRCKFSVQANDLLATPTTLDISLGTDRNSDRDIEKTCKELSTCFAHETLSCETANFCHVPGLINRKIK